MTDISRQDWAGPSRNLVALGVIIGRLVRLEKLPPLPVLIFMVAMPVWAAAQLFFNSEILMIGPLTYGDLLFPFSLITAALYPGFRKELVATAHSMRLYIGVVFAFCVLGFASLWVNAFIYSVEFSSIFEVWRPLFYVALLITLAVYCRAGYFTPIMVSYLLGLLGGTALNFVQTFMSGGIVSADGVMEYFNPNVTGNMIDVGMFLCVIWLAVQPTNFSIIAVATGAIAVFFSYSKGAWLMAFLALGAFFMVYVSSGKRLSRGMKIARNAMLGLGAIAATALVVTHMDFITSTIEFKLKQSVSDRFTQGQSTVALRRGQVLSSLEIMTHDPILGVGVKNWEVNNDRNRYWLHDIFLKNDNPHNGFFYILSCMGIPAFFLFIYIVLLPVYLYLLFLPTKLYARLAFAAAFLLFLVLSGNVMVHIIANYFLWIFTGFAVFLARRSMDDAAGREHPVIFRTRTAGRLA